MEKEEFHLPYFLHLKMFVSAWLKMDGFICTGDNVFADKEIVRISLNRKNEEQYLEIQLKDGSVHYESREGYKRLVEHYQEFTKELEAKKNK